MPSQLFISKRDIIWPEEEESEPELDEEGQPKKKKKKKGSKKVEYKMYPKHEYAYPAIGKFQKKKKLDSVFDEEDAELYNSTLSYFSKANVTKNTSEFHKTDKDRLDAR